LICYEKRLLGRLRLGSLFCQKWKGFLFMVKLKFLPDYFPFLLLPVYWISWLCFYIGYLPFYLVILLLSPYKSKKDLVAFYEKKASKVKRDLTYTKDTPPKSPDGGE